MAKRPETDVPRELKTSGDLCLAFANTGAPRLDDRNPTAVRSAETAPPVLRHYGDLIEWSRRMGVLDNADAERIREVAAVRIDDAKNVFAKALTLRKSLVRIFTAVAQDAPTAAKDLERINGLLADALTCRRLVARGKRFGWAWRGDESALEQPLWRIAWSAAELLSSDGLRWVRQCAGSGCPRLFLDRKSRLRKWCDMNTCGNRSKGRRYRDKRRRWRHG